jgi:hypothetical protein
MLYVLPHQIYNEVEEIDEEREREEKQITRIYENEREKMNHVLILQPTYIVNYYMS